MLKRKKEMLFGVFTIFLLLTLLGCGSGGGGDGGGESKDPPKVFCGDGRVNNGDECDDGNQNNFDDCRNNCTLPACGDGINDINEDCDDGQNNGIGCAPPYNGSCEYCNLGCETITLFDGNCGDGNIDILFEECDDGNNIDGDGCAANCITEYCGDGIANNLPNEECDDGNQNNFDGCRNNCTSPFCGDGINDSNEECDDANLNNLDSCRNDCTLPYCGDGINDSNEECDNGQNNGQVCTPNYGSSCTYCNNCVVIEVFGAYCGDQTCNGSELCDDCPSDCGTCPIQVNYKMYGTNFSPYMTGQDPNLLTQITIQQLRQRMGKIRYHTDWVRSFGSTHGLENTCMVAREYNLSCAAGAWLDGDLITNEPEIDNLIQAAQAGYVDIVIVGSEVLLRGDLTEAQLIAYIRRVKQALPGITVTTADIYSVLIAHPNVINEIDVVFANYYPYWEGIKFDYAIANLHTAHQNMVNASGSKEVYVSEIGWPSCGNTIGQAVPNPVNAAAHFLNFVSWAEANNVKYFYFEAFDEEWKAQHEGPQGACWGTWDRDGNLKPGMQDVFDGITIPDNWTCRDLINGLGTPSIEFTNIPPYNTFFNLEGRISHVIPADYKIAVYIKVGGGWWIKPYFNRPKTNINCDGTWVTDITTGGIDQTATYVRAYLIPADYDPPSVGNIATLPQELTDNSLDMVEVYRSP